MRCSSLAVLALAASANAFADSVHKRALTKRQDASTSYLPSIIAAATPACLPGCQDIPKVIAQCSATAASEEETGRCACGQTTLGIIRGCASCIVADPLGTTGQVPLMQYNAFVNQCISLGFANGTALAPIAGETVTTAKQITTFASSGASSATGKASNAPSSVAKQNAATSASASPASASPTSGAEKLVGAGLLSALVVAAGAILA